MWHAAVVSSSGSHASICSWASYEIPQRFEPIEVCRCIVVVYVVVPNITFWVLGLGLFGLRVGIGIGIIIGAGVGVGVGVGNGGS